MGKAAPSTCQTSRTWVYTSGEKRLQAEKEEAFTSMTSCKGAIPLVPKKQIVILYGKEDDIPKLCIENSTMGDA